MKIVLTSNNLKKTNVVKSTFSKKLKRSLKLDLTVWDILLTAGHFVFWIGDTFLFFMVAVRMDYIGLTKDQIVITMVARGAIRLTRIIPSYLIDKYKTKWLKVTAMCTFLMGAVAMVSMAFTTFPLMLVYFVFWGLCNVSFNLYLYKDNTSS